MKIATVAPRMTSSSGSDARRRWSNNFLSGAFTMDTPRRSDRSDFSRRRFLQRSSLAMAGAAAAAQFPFLGAVHAAGRDAEIKIGLIGCGGRGTGAVLDALGAATKVIYPSAGYHTEDVAEGAKLAAQRHQGRRPGRPVRGPARPAARSSSPSWASTIPKEMLLHRLRRLQATAGRARDQLRDPGHPAAFPARAPQGGHRGGQERLHREAGRPSTCPA